MTPARHLSRLYGLTIESPFPLPGAKSLPATHAVPDVMIRWQPESAWREITKPLTSQPEADADRPWLGMTSEGELCLEWRRDLQFVINPANDQIVVVCRPAKLEFAPTALIGIGLGLLLHRRGVLCIHGSALSINGRTITLVGDSGAGKSTTAASLIVRGATLISDDVVALRPCGDDFIVEPGSTSLRLGQAAKTRILGADLQLSTAPWVDKLLWDVSTEDGREPQSRRLDAIYLLGDAEGFEGVRPAPLAPLLALRELITALYPQGFSTFLTQEQLTLLRAVAERVPVIVLRYPRRWDILPELYEVLGG